MGVAYPKSAIIRCPLCESRDRPFHVTHDVFSCGDCRRSFRVQQVPTSPKRKPFGTVRSHGEGS